MSDNIGQLYVRNDGSADDDAATVASAANSGAAALTAIKSPSLSSLRNLRDSFIRSDSTSSQLSSSPKSLSSMVGTSLKKSESGKSTHILVFNGPTMIGTFLITYVDLYIFPYAEIIKIYILIGTYSFVRLCLCRNTIEYLLNIILTVLCWIFYVATSGFTNICTLYLIRELVLVS